MKRSAWLLVVIILGSTSISFAADEEEKLWDDYFGALVLRDPAMALDHFTETSQTLDAYGSGIALASDRTSIEIVWDWDLQVFWLTTSEGETKTDDLPDAYGRHVFSLDGVSGWVDIWEGNAFVRIRYDGVETAWTGVLPDPTQSIAIVAQQSCLCKGSLAQCPNGVQDCQDQQPCNLPNNGGGSRCAMAPTPAPNPPPPGGCMPLGVSAVILPMAIISYRSRRRRRAVRPSNSNKS